jgi:hypothetical protein
VPFLTSLSGAGAFTHHEPGTILTPSISGVPTRGSASGLGAATRTISHSSTTGNVLLALVSRQVGVTMTGVTATWNGVAMTVLAEATGDQASSGHGIIAVKRAGSTGTRNCVITGTGGNIGRYVAIVIDLLNLPVSFAGDADAVVEVEVTPAANALAAPALITTTQDDSLILAVSAGIHAGVDPYAEVTDWGKIDDFDTGSTQDGTQPSAVFAWRPGGTAGTMHSYNPAGLTVTDDWLNLIVELKGEAA